jgi:hypothetical protein
MDRTITSIQVLLMLATNARQVLLEGFVPPLRQDTDPILIPFSGPDYDLVLPKIQIFYAQPQAFHQPQTTAIEQLDHKPLLASQLIQHDLHFRPGQHHR